MPYSDDILDKLHGEGSVFWCYKGPLICFYIVEYHQPDRCMCQFGKIQDIPSPHSIYFNALHNITLKGKTDIDWRNKHREHILS